MSRNQLDENFRTNVDALYDFMKCIIYSSKDEKYEKAKDWLDKNNFKEVYEFFASHSLVANNEIKALIKEYNNSDQYACKEGCIVVTASTAKLDGAYLESNDSRKIYDKMKMIFDNLKLDQSIFMCEDTTYAFHKGEIISENEIKDNKSKGKKNKTELKDSNYEMIKEFIVKWYGKEHHMQDSMSFEDYLYTISVLKCLVPPEYQIGKGSSKTTHKKGYEQYMEEFSDIDECVFRYYVDHNNDDWKQFNDSEWIERYCHVLNTFNVPQLDIKEFTSKITTLRNISVVSSSKIMSELNSRIYQNIREMTLKTDEFIEECIKNNLYFENDPDYEYKIKDFMEQ